VTEELKEDIGTILKTRREVLGHSLKDAAERTRIRKGYLESLEQNKFKDLPGEAYVTGFIKVYAGYLGLDSGPLLKMLAPSQARSQSTESEPAIAKTKAQVVKTAAKPSSSTWRPFVVGFLVILVLGALIFFLLPETKQEPAPVVEQPQASTEQSQAPVQEEIVPSVQQNTSTPAEITEPVAEAHEEKTEPVVETHEEKAAPQLILPAIKAGGSSLRMLALTDGSLIIYVDNRQPHEYPLHEGLDLTWKIREKVALELGGTEQARFWLDGKELKLGDSLSIKLEQAQ